MKPPASFAIDMLPAHLEDALREVEVTLPALGRAVLLVDDEPENLEVLRAVLEETWPCYLATSAAEALDCLEHNPAVGLVIADQRMPNLSGVELLARIAVEYPGVARILLTAYSDVEPMFEALNRDLVYRFIVKPCEPEELRAAVEDALRVREGELHLRFLVKALEERRALLERTLEELSEAQERLLAAERTSTVGRAACGIVHDLRNLSTIMSLLVEDIRGQAGDSDLLGCAQAALDGLNGLIRVLESVQQFARANSHELRPVVTDMRRLLRQSLLSVGSEQGLVRCPVELEVTQEAATLRVDPDRISQALGALLENAMRASPPDRVVRVAVRRVDPDQTNCADCISQAWACIEVADQGCGMDATTLARATEPLFSAFVPPRLGLGLALAQLAAEAHGGRLELESAPGRGTRAKLLLPFEPLEEKTC